MVIAFCLVVIVPEATAWAWMMAIGLVETVLKANAIVTEAVAASPLALPVALLSGAMLPSTEVCLPAA